MAFGILQRLGALLWFTPPRGDTLQERYPAAPGAFTTSYSSIDLPEEAFVAQPRDQALIDIRQRFRGDVEETLRALREAAIEAEATIAEVGPDRAYRAWCQRGRAILEAHRQ